MVLAMAAFIANDSLVKLASASLPAPQLIGVRGLFACALILAVARASGVVLPPRQMGQGWVALRALVDAAATFGYLFSLFNLPLANATAINMATPLFITLAVATRGAPVGWRRWMATAVGFTGVLLIIQPSAGGFNGWAWLCLVATLAHALRDLMTARIPRALPSLAIVLATAMAVTAVALGWTAVQGWQPMTLAQVGGLAAAAVFLATGYFALVKATRGTDLSLVAPFRYSGLLLALVLGWLLWGDVPNLLAWCGIALIVAAGAYLLRAPPRAPAND
jgi:drug/metabolite transporter (DMT)-like permease